MSAVMRLDRLSSVMHRRGAMALALAALVLTACATNEGFRDPDARISATTRFDPARMQGAWQVQERVASAEDPAAHAPGKLRLRCR